MKIDQAANRKKVLNAIKKLECALPNIIAKEAKVHRNTAMKHLDKLVEEGLVHLLRPKAGRGKNSEPFVYYVDGAETK